MINRQENQGRQLMLTGALWVCAGFLFQFAKWTYQSKTLSQNYFCLRQISYVQDQHSAQNSCICGKLLQCNRSYSLISWVSQNNRPGDRKMHTSWVWRTCKKGMNHSHKLPAPKSPHFSFSKGNINLSRGHQVTCVRSALITWKMFSSFLWLLSKKMIFLEGKLIPSWDKGLSPQQRWDESF